jgi:hypothetical protein
VLGGTPEVRDRPSVVACFLEVACHLRFDHSGVRAVGVLEPFPETLVEPHAASCAHPLDQGLRI